MTSKLMSAAGDLEALAVFRGPVSANENELTAKWMIVSATADVDDQSASCVRTTTTTRCVSFAGYDRHHLIDTFARQHYPTVPTPAWAQSMFAIDTKADPAHDDWREIVVHLDGADPVLGIDDVEGVRFAVRRGGRWYVSAPISGGKSRRPMYFGSLDTSVATRWPSLGIVVGSYLKESCVRSETDDLVVFQLGADHQLVEHERVKIGEAVWVADPSQPVRYGPFDPADPNHYLIRLAPTIAQDGRVRLEIAERHTPRRLRDRATVCGVAIGASEIDRLLRLVGSHALRELPREPLDDQEMP